MDATANGKMTVDEAERELARLRRRINATNTKLDLLYAQRAAVFLALKEHGWRQSAIARKAGVTPMAVAFALERYAPSHD